MAPLGSAVRVRANINLLKSATPIAMVIGID